MAQPYIYYRTSIKNKEKYKILITLYSMVVLFAALNKFQNLTVSKASKITSEPIAEIHEHLYFFNNCSGGFLRNKLKWKVTFTPGVRIQNILNKRQRGQEPCWRLQHTMRFLQSKLYCGVKKNNSTIRKTIKAMLEDA